MVAVLCNEGQNDMLNILEAAIAANLRVGLYTADAGAGKVTTLANITAATFAGYAAATPTLVAFGLDANGKTQFAGVNIVFTRSTTGAPQTIIGYYVWNISTGFLYFKEAFGTPVIIDTAGQHIDVKPDLFAGDLTTPY